MNRNNRSISYGVWTAIALASVAPGVAPAQTAPDPEGIAEVPTSDIVVTARRVLVRKGHAA